LLSVSGDDRIERHIFSVHVFDLDASRPGDVAVPAFMVVVIDIIDGEDVEPAVAVVGLNEAISAPEQHALEVQVLAIEAGFKC